MKLFIAYGYYDLATPYFAAKYTVAHMNLDPSLGSYLFDESRTGKAGELVPAWVEEMLNDRG